MTSKTHNVTIWIAGDLSTIREACRKFCLGGLCVSVTPTEFVFTGGLETGAAVGLINYARFPKEPAEIDALAMTLAIRLMTACCQRSCSVVFPNETRFLENPDITAGR